MESHSVQFSGPSWHDTPSLLNVFPVQARHAPFATSNPGRHLVHDGLDCPSMPETQLGMAVHDMPSELYDVPLHGVHDPLESLFIVADVPGRVKQNEKDGRKTCKSSRGDCQCTLGER